MSMEQKISMMRFLYGISYNPKLEIYEAHNKALEGVFDFLAEEDYAEKRESIRAAFKELEDDFKSSLVQAGVEEVEYDKIAYLDRAVSYLS